MSPPASIRAFFFDSQRRHLILCVSLHLHFDRSRPFSFPSSSSYPPQHPLSAHQQPCIATAPPPATAEQRQREHLLRRGGHYTRVDSLVRLLTCCLHSTPRTHCSYTATTFVSLPFFPTPAPSSLAQHQHNSPSLHRQFCTATATVRAAKAPPQRSVHLM